MVGIRIAWGAVGMHTLVGAADNRPQVVAAQNTELVCSID